MSDAEEWTSVHGWPGYRVSNLGRVKSYKRSCGKLLSLSIKSNGYQQVTLSKDCKTKNWSVHRLIWMAFNPQRRPMMGKLVLHLNGNKIDNRLENLYLGTAVDNANDAYRHGVLNMGNSHWKSKLKVCDIHRIRALISTGNMSQADLARSYGVHSSTISKIATGKNWRRTV